MLPSTFQEYAKTGYTSITNGLDNAVSAMAYIKSRYNGNVNNIPGLGTSSYKGYANGTESVPTDGVYRVGEDNKSEIVTLPQGAGVIKNDFTKNLMDWGKFNPKTMLSSVLPKFNSPNIASFSSPNSSKVSSTDNSMTIQNLTVVANDPTSLFRQLKARPRNLQLD